MSGVSPKAVFAGSTRLLLATGALFLLACGTIWPIAGIAEPVEGSRATQNAWRKVCYRAPSALSDTESGSAKPPATAETMEVCYTLAGIRDQSTGMNIGVIGVLQAHPFKKMLLLAMLPPRPRMNPDPGYLRFEDGTQINLTFLPNNHCDGFYGKGYAICSAKAELSESLLERIKGSKALTFGAHDAAGRSLSIPLACGGFAEAFAGAPGHVQALRPTLLDLFQ